MNMSEIISDVCSPNMSEKIWKISPSDFAYLWDECKRCFYLKIVNGFFRPRTIMPRIFKIIDAQMKQCFAGQRLETLIHGVTGAVQYTDELVESQIITFSGIQSSCYIRGKFDTIVKFEDDTYGIVDFKTSEITGNYISIFSRQLNAYAYAIENSTSGGFSCRPVKTLGLIIYEPREFSCRSAGDAFLTGELKWLEIPHDEKKFLEFIREVLTLLDKPTPPDPSPSCEWCKYREKARVTGLY